MHHSSQNVNRFYKNYGLCFLQGPFFALRAARRGADCARPLCRFATFPHTVGNHHSSQNVNRFYKNYGLCFCRVLFLQTTPEAKYGFGCCFIYNTLSGIYHLHKTFLSHILVRLIYIFHYIFALDYQFLLKPHSSYHPAALC